MARVFKPLFLPFGAPVVGENGLIEAGSDWELFFRDVVERTLFQEVFTESLTPASVAANTVAEQQFTVTGARTDMAFSVTPPSITAGVGPITCRASADNTVQVAFVNPTAGALTPPAGSYEFLAVRP